MITDSIGNYLTKIRNAYMAKHKVVDVPCSNLKKDITKILKDQGYILNYKFIDNGNQGVIRIALKYDLVTKIPAIKKIKRVSRPGLRNYSPKDGLPRVLNGLGIAIISTSRGVMTDKHARKINVGGEVLCLVY
ncbi:MAG: 30S ribosomal protein S8 [Flavobacteriales bacterium]|nr:30S ribosomal protein S8 [Flavobacteriales bacterium]|tara:strand:- start:7701 stop:8099 length:399 start_codon:yes stop_codon:yes gene_type:complete